MQKFAILIASVMLLFSMTASALADTYVSGYTKKDGTYVQPHYRSSPDRSYNNNWSVRPNVNPHTGRRGTRSPTFNNRPPNYNLLGRPQYNSRRQRGSSYR